MRLSLTIYLAVGFNACPRGFTNDGAMTARAPNARAFLRRKLKMQHAAVTVAYLSSSVDRGNASIAGFTKTERAALMAIVPATRDLSSSATFQRLKRQELASAGRARHAES